MAGERPANCEPSKYAQAIPEHPDFRFGVRIYEGAGFRELHAGTNQYPRLFVWDFFALRCDGGGSGAV